MGGGDGFLIFGEGAGGKSRLLVNGGGKVGGRKEGREGMREGWCVCIFSLPLCVY